MENKRVENPFSKCKPDTDVLIQTSGTVKLYLHYDIVAQYSSSLKEMLDVVDEEEIEGHPMKVITLSDQQPDIIVEMFKMLYPETQTVITEHTKYEDLLSISHKYQVTILTEKVEDYLTDVYYENKVNDSTKNIGGLELADRFQLLKLREKLLRFIHYDSFDVLQRLPQAEHLKVETIYLLAKLRTSRSTARHRAECDAILEFYDRIFYRDKRECLDYDRDETDKFGFFKKSKKKSKNYIDDESFVSVETTPAEPIIDNPFGTRSYDTDVILRVGTYNLYVHAATLKHNSPVFNAQLINATKLTIEMQEFIELKFPGKRAIDVIELFKFIYDERFNQFRDDTRFESLLALCHEYQIKWLTQRIEEHLRDNVYTKSFDDKRNIWGLHLADRYNLMKLRSKLLTLKYGAFSQLIRLEGFTWLEEDTILHLARYRFELIFPNINNNNDDDNVAKNEQKDGRKVAEYEALKTFFDDVIHV